MASSDIERGGAKNGRYNRENFDVETSNNEWTSWLIPMFVVANVAVFVLVMYINNCPKDNPNLNEACVAKFLGRLSFQPLHDNPLFGPSSATWVFSALPSKVSVFICFLSVLFCLPFEVGWILLFLVGVLFLLIRIVGLVGFFLNFFFWDIVVFFEGY